MATKKVTRSRGTKKPAPKAPAPAAKLSTAARSEVQKLIRDVEEQAAAENAAFESRSAARDAVNAQLIPMSFGDLCRMIGRDVDAQEFATTSLMSLAMQLDGLELMAREDTDGGYDQWCAVTNVVDRMKLASRVSRWLDRGKPEALPEVVP